MQKKRAKECVRAAQASASSEPMFIRTDAGEAALRGDIKITGCVGIPNTIIADVTVTSIESENNRRAAQTKLGAARRKEEEKRGKYKDRTARENKQFFPLVMENTGAFGPKFLELLDALRQTAIMNEVVIEHDSYVDFAQPWMQKIAIAQRKWIAKGIKETLSSYKPNAGHLDGVFG